MTFLLLTLTPTHRYGIFIFSLCGHRMCLLARLVDAAGPLQGGALISRLHACGKHGDNAARELVSRVMDRVCVPLFAFITRYILYSHLYSYVAILLIDFFLFSSPKYPSLPLPLFDDTSLYLAPHLIPHLLLPNLTLLHPQVGVAR